MCSGTVNYTAGGTGTGQGFPPSLVAVRVGGGGGGSGGQRPNVSWTKHMKLRSQYLSLCCLILPYNRERKRQPSTAGLTERHFQSPAERSQIRTRNLMYSNRASVITLDCMSEINCKQSKCFLTSDILEFGIPL